MRHILFFVLRILKLWNGFILILRGQSEADIHAKRIISGEAWNEFCDQLKAAQGALKYPGAPQDAFAQAEGTRYLTRLTRAALEAFVEYNDPSFPAFRRMVHETVKMGADNPDNYYFNARISGNYEYRITGKRNTIHYFGFFTQNGDYGTTGGMSPCDAIDHSSIVYEVDGSFEIILSRSPKGKNWLKMTGDTRIVIVRQTFLDRLREVPAELSIANLDGRRNPEPLNPAAIDEGLKTAALFVAGAPLLFARWARGFRKHTNTLPQFDPEVSNAAGGDTGIIYYHSYWQLATDEALVIEVKPPSCDSWNFQLNNYWMESLDYRYFTVCINKATAEYSSDGGVKVIVAHNDPGLPNWIETCGHTEGTMCWRWYRLAPGADPTEPRCKVVKTENLLS